MLNAIKTLTFLAAGALVLCGASGADSLWSDQKGSMFKDYRASKVGDTITVLVLESATSSQSASTDVNRESKFDTGPGTGPLLKNIPQLGYGGSSASTGDGKTSRQSNLITTMTVTVREVLPNGNLVVSGDRQVKTNEEMQKISLTGVIRPMDVGPDNTIASTSIADAKIEHTGKGPIGARQKEGIVTQIIRLLF